MLSPSLSRGCLHSNTHTLVQVPTHKPCLPDTILALSPGV